MTHPLSWQTVTSNPQATEDIGERVGKQLRGSEIIELVSDLGGGKTTFVRGLARGIGSSDHVSSPTFTINNVYKGTNLKLNHFDFYRLHEAGVVAHELEEAIQEPHSVLVVEWANIVNDVLPREHLTITFTPELTESRHLLFTFPTRYQYLMGSISK